MKIKRYKKVHRVLRFYSLHFGFRKPYQVLIDGTICLAALKNKINLSDQLTKYLDGEVKLLTTQCIVKETEALGFFGASLIVKQFPVHQCGHSSPVPGSKCLLSMVGQENSSRYVLATQDRELQEKCRLLPGVPLLYLHITSPTLEAPSPASHAWADKKTRETCAVRPEDHQALVAMKGGEEEAPKPRLGKKRPRAPNPLSCKKKKGKPGQGVGQVKKEKKSRKRKRTVFEKKVRKELKSSVGE